MHHSFGQELRHRRSTANLGLRQLAAVVHVSVGYLSKLENNTRRPSPEMAARLDAALHADGALRSSAQHPPAPGGDMYRRAVLRAVAAAGMAAAGWPIAVSDDLPHRISQDHLDDVITTTGLYRGWVTRHGGTAVRDPVALLLERACHLHAAATGRIRKDLLAAIADLAGLGAYVARDVGDHTSAAEQSRIALSAATASGQTALAGHTVVRMAGHSIELRDPRRVLAYLDAAADHAGHLFTPGDRANQACIRAWAHAQTGNADATARAAGEAEEVFTRPTSPVPGWAAQHVTEAELHSLIGAAFVELATQQPRYAGQAIDRLRTAIDARGVSLGRNRVLDQVSLAEALVVAGEFDEAGRVALVSKAEAEGIMSGRLGSRLGGLAARLQPYASRSDACSRFLNARHNNPTGRYA